MRADDVADFSAFVSARSGALFRTAVLLTGEREAAEDLVQSTLERCCRHWRTVSRADAPEAYARRILVNLVHDGGRRRRHREVPLEPENGGRREGGGGADLPPDPYRQVVLRDALVQALRTLPAGMRTAVVLRYFDDLPDAEIAAALGISESAVRSQVARGLAKLRAAVRDGAVRSPQGGDR
ncbi:SigE family RNA polymerase sigma factor [Streptomyces sp. V4-01]|uniref:SigE family RNA polymerase sigma factor n=1 Tax=Actinacidiphila polyblastidii TaxID=3110430 RepID=A0ABU7PGN5_9ACTN|nr:SigE family RNA polymerase sigma factor [Streptomyces sp. V4-01]